MRNKKLLGNSLLLLTAFIWGTAFAAQRTGMESIEPITFNAARMVLAAAAVGLLAWRIAGREPASAVGAADEPAGLGRRNRRDIIGGLCCGAFLTAASLAQQVGLVYTSAGKAGFITAMYMILVPVIDSALFKKRQARTVWLAVLLGVGGMYLLCVTESLSLNRGDVWVGLCALLFSGHILCCDHFARQGNPLRISAVQFAAAAVISAVLALILESPSWDKIQAAFWPIVYCGLISGGLGYTLQMTAQKYTEPAVASLLMSLESVFAVLAGAVLLDERLTARELWGCIVMFAAIVTVQIPGADRESKGDNRD